MRSTYETVRDTSDSRSWSHGRLLLKLTNIKHAIALTWIISIIFSVPFLFLQEWSESRSTCIGPWSLHMNQARRKNRWLAELFAGFCVLRWPALDGPIIKKKTTKFYPVEIRKYSIFCQEESLSLIYNSLENDMLSCRNFRSGKDLLFLH